MKKEFKPTITDNVNITSILFHAMRHTADRVEWSEREITMKYKTGDSAKFQVQGKFCHIICSDPATRDDIWFDLLGRAGKRCGDLGILISLIDLVDAIDKSKQP